MTGMWMAVRFAADTEFDPDQVSPGPAGFWAIAALAVLIILLGFNLVRRLRRNAYRTEIREQIEQELAERDAAGSGATGSGPGADPARPDAVDPVDPGPATPDERK